MCDLLTHDQADEIPAPTFQDTFLFRGPKFLYNQTIGRALGKQTIDHIAWEATGSPGVGIPEVNGGLEPSLEAAVPANANGEARKRKVTRAK